MCLASDTQIQYKCAWGGDARIHFKTDPRDKIYGFLGLATDIQESDIPVEYDSSEATGYVHQLRKVSSD